MVTWEEALTIHRRNKKIGNHNYKEKSYINWYIDDYKFDSQSIKKIGEDRDKYNCIWNYPNDAWRVIEHFEGIPKNSIVCIGTVGGGPRKKKDRKRFEIGLAKMVKVLKPHTILVYGSAKGRCFDELRKNGIKIIPFKSRTEKFYEGGGFNE